MIVMMMMMMLMLMRGARRGVGTARACVAALHPPKRTKDWPRRFSSSNAARSSRAHTHTHQASIGRNNGKIGSLFAFFESDTRPFSKGVEVVVVVCVCGGGRLID